MASQSPSPSATDEPLSVAVVREIADHDDVDPMELSPPLFHCLDPAALDALFEPTRSGGPRSGSVSFTYDDKRVTVDSDGTIEIDSAAATETETETETDRHRSG